MRMVVKRLVPLLIAVGVVNASPQSVTYSDSSSVATGTLSIPKFNPAIGHLIKADLVASVDSYFWCEATVIDFTEPLAIPLSIISETHLGSLIQDSQQIDTTTYFQNAGPFVYGDAQQFSETIAYRGNQVNQLIGTGQISLDYSTDAHFAYDPSVSTSTEVDHCNVSVSITYTYN